MEKNNPTVQADGQRRILVLFAHPSSDRSEVNQPLAEASSNVDGVTLVDLYAEYPEFIIDIDREQARLLEHDVIVFMHPLYWYSTPAILKEWQDLVLEHGFAYGSEGTALHGKLFLNAVTAGGADTAYQPGGYNNFSLRQLLYPLEQTARMCGMVYLPPFVLFSSRTAVEEGRVEAHVNDWLETLRALRDGHLDIDQIRQRSLFNQPAHDIPQEA